MEINHLAVIVAAISDLLVGALWFSPLLFYRPWLKATGLREENLKGGQARVFGLTLLMALIISYNLAAFLGEEGTDAAWGATAGFLAGVWAAAGLVIIALFERKNLTYILINCGYLLIAFTLKGFIIGLWR
ncbi:MAG: DUF1761 domain-containing protein [Owenweeksia sp.]